MAFAPSPEARALSVASLQAAIIGSLACNLALIVVTTLNGDLARFLSSYNDGGTSAQPTFTEMLWSAIMLGLVWLPFTLFLGLIFGTISVGACLTVFGFPIATLFRSQLAQPFGFLLAVAAAVVVAGLLVAFFFSDTIALVALAYAIPAAVCYWRQIRLERACD